MAIKKLQKEQSKTNEKHHGSICHDDDEPSSGNRDLSNGVRESSDAALQHDLRGCRVDP